MTKNQDIKEMRRAVYQQLKQKGYSYWKIWLILHKPTRDKGVRETIRKIRKVN